MTDDEHFSEVIRELSRLLTRLGPLGQGAVLIGGQVLAIEGLRRGGSGVIQATTDTGITVERGFSLEPDLLLDLEVDRFMADQLPEVLRSEGYERIREFRWAKELEGSAPRRIELDLFRPTEVDPDLVPTGMTELPDGKLVLQHSVPVELVLGSSTVRLRLPGEFSFLAMKLRAKRQHRPEATKDSYDIYAYVQLHGAAAISKALREAGAPGRSALTELKTLFWTIDSPGVMDVLASAPGLAPHERDLLAQAVVDLFGDL